MKALILASHTDIIKDEVTHKETKVMTQYIHRINFTEEITNEMMTIVMTKGYYSRENQIGIS